MFYLEWPCNNFSVYWFCRHGFLLAALNMATGERWAYATYLMHVLMHEHGILPYVMMYDINCKWVLLACLCRITTVLYH